jgi:hypothetical protein
MLNLNKAGHYRSTIVAAAFSPPRTARDPSDMEINKKSLPRTAGFRESGVVSPETSLNALQENRHRPGRTDRHCIVEPDGN